MEALPSSEKFINTLNYYVMKKYNIYSIKVLI